MNSQIRTYNKILSTLNIKIEPFDANKRFTKPHKHNKYLEIVYFTEGSGFHFIDAKSNTIKPYSAFLIHKNQVHHWEINSIPKGFVIIIKESFLDDLIDVSIPKLLNQLKEVQVIQLQPIETIELLFRALCLETQNSQPNQAVIEGGLKAILSILISEIPSSMAFIHNDLEQKFIELLSAKPKNNVAFYAEQLNTSTQNINAICQKAFQKSASAFIATEMIKEIKRQLAYTNKNINEIAFDLDFKDNSHFTKFFKRNTTQTPLEYRKQTQLT